MYLAIGDVVRIRSDQTLGTVAGITSSATGAMVHIDLGQGAIRVARPTDLERVMKCYRPMTTGRHVATLLLGLVGLVVGVVTGLTVYDLGAHMALAVFVTYSVTENAIRVLITVAHRPRAVRV